MEGFAVPLADVALLLSHLKGNDCDPMGWVEALDQLPELSPGGRDGLRAISQLLEGFPPSANPWTVLSSVLLDRTRIAAEIAANSDFRARSRGVAIWQFMNFVRTQPGGPGLPVTRLLARIRRLILLLDERDLRQLPAAAQGIDAVRLMTMHGSKGLEFPVVHIPGLNNGAMPRYPNAMLARGISPPDGMIDGADGKAVDAVRAALSAEQECLFFVSLSRAKNRLFMYSPTRTSNGRDRPRSPFIDRLGARIVSRHVVPAATLPVSEGDQPVALTIEGQFTFSDHQIALYQRCPRRFLYTHILEVGGRRMETAFMELHVAVQKVVDEMATEAVNDFSLARLEASLEAAWSEHGPDDEGEDYKRIALRLIRFFAGTLSGMTPLPVPQLRLPVEDGEIVVTPDQVASDGAGKVVMRRVDTGHKGSKDHESLATAAFHLAATAHSPGCAVELVYLSDAEIAPVTMTPKVLGNRRQSIEEIGSAVRSGMFPLNETITCPRCPAFFICSRLPAGEIKKKILA